MQIGAAFVGAQEKIESGIHKQLLNKGYDSVILYATGVSEVSGIIRYESKLLNLLRRGLIKIFGKNDIFASFSTMKLIKLLKKYNPDVVHLHVLHHNYVNYAMLLNYLAKKNIPVLFTMHDMWAFTGGCYHYTEMNCQNYKSECKVCPAKEQKLDCRVRSVEKNFKKKKKLFGKIKRIAFSTVSSWVYNQMDESFLNHYPRYLVRNAVSIDRLPEKKLVKDGIFKIVGVASSWNEEKGIFRFLKLAESLGNGFEIILAGNVSNEIKQIAPSNITFVGMISNKVELSKIYDSSDLHVSLSYEETFGMTFVEAALCGIKSLGFNSTAISEILGMIDGFVVKSGDVDAVVEKIFEISKNYC